MPPQKPVSSRNRIISLTVIFICFALATFPFPSLSETMAGRDFLKWDSDSQDAMIQTSITMAGVIATQTRPSVSRCIDEWYFSTTNIKGQRNEYIRKTIKDNAEFHPSATILAVLQKRCGPFK